MFPLVVFFVALAVYLPFCGAIPVTDPVEANYALTAKEMLTSGDWLSPQIYGQYWYDKPAMIYWLIAGSFKLFGVSEFAARFPAAVFSAASVSFITWFAKRLFGSWQVGLLAALVLGTSLEYWVLARMIITDAVLFFFGSVALGTLYLGMDEQGKGWYVAAYFFAGLAVLTKGPVGIVLPMLTIFIYIVVTRRWVLFTRLFILPGLAIFFLTAAPWYIAMYKAHGKDFLDTFLGLHNYLRATVSEHPKDNVFYYYLVLFPVSMLPWSGVLFRSLVSTRAPHFSFLAVWMGVTIGFYTLMATKYPTYVFPALFPAALMTAHHLEKMVTARPRQWLWLSLPVLFLLVALAAAPKFLPDANWLGFYLVIALAAVSILWFQYRGDAALLPWVAGAAVMAVSLILIFQGLIPLAETRSARAVIRDIPVQGAIVAAYGEYPTSAVFYSGYRIPRLVQDNKEVPPGDVWVGKYTMPTEGVASFAARSTGNPDTYVLISRGSIFPLSGYQPVAEFGRFSLQKQTILK
ncbi:MAG: glycosyltransferase family 39 protein [Negativicutes bacterium]|nr:glycosyltransferase family 39 protein [Negativicutes bacterium]